MSDVSGLPAAQTHQASHERVELSSSAHGPSTPVAPYGAPSLGLADRISFPSEAHRAFGEAGQ